MCKKLLFFFFIFIYIIEKFVKILILIQLENERAPKVKKSDLAQLGHVVDEDGVLMLEK